MIFSGERYKFSGERKYSFKKVAKKMNGLLWNEQKPVGGLGEAVVAAHMRRMKITSRLSSYLS